MAFPNVPNVPGVPPLPRNPNAVVTGIELLVSDVISTLGDFLPPQWGIFKNGLPVVTFDSVVSFDYKQDWSISTFPLEQGAFESYDKVQLPFDARVRFASRGTEAGRQALIDTVAAIAGTLDLYDVVTPDAVYKSSNVIHHDYRRTATNGVGMVIVDVWLQQVRATAQAAFSSTQATANAEGALAGPNAGAFQAGSTKAPSGADAVAAGNVQATEAPIRITVPVGGRF